MSYFSHQNTILQLIKASVTADAVAAVVPEDLEVAAHSTQWEETDGTELTFIKLCPHVTATQIEHEYARITSYGERRGSGFFNETGLPGKTAFKPDRIKANIRLIGEQSETFILAALEETVQALGTQGNVNIEAVALRLNLLWKKNHYSYFADTRTIRQGDAGPRFKGMLQLIEEGTDGISPFGSHVIDMEGQPFTPETLREKISDAITLFGYLRCLIMPPSVREGFEKQYDSAQRLDMPISMKPYMIGQQIAGLQTQGSTCFFHTDNSLSPIWHFGSGKYTAELMEDGPTTTSTVTGVVNSPGLMSSKFDAPSSGALYYVVTELKQEQEGLGVRVPATGFLDVAPGEDVTLSLTPGDPSIDAWRIYRGSDADPNNVIGTDAFWVADVPNLPDTGYPVVWRDQNHQRPNTSWAFGFNMISDAHVALTTEGYAQGYHAVQERSASFFGQPDRKGNTVAMAHLGPSMGTLELAHLLPQVARPLHYSACAPLLRNPLHAFAFKNIGRA